MNSTISKFSYGFSFFILPNASVALVIPNWFAFLLVKFALPVKPVLKQDQRNPYPNRNRSFFQ